MSEEKFGCRIDRLPSACALEFVFFARPPPDTGESTWASGPGAVRYDTAQRPLMLHFAPGRWLAPDPTVEIRALLNTAALAALGVIVAVTGKYDALSISGPGATRLLACAIDADAILQARDCAALTLFDCPAILARAPAGYALWVQSSYTADFVTTAERFRALHETTS